MVSVVITTRNEERNLRNCLLSVRAQSYPQERIEIIVVDNNSTDRTVEIAREFTPQVFTMGPERSAQRNHGIIEKARGDVVLYLDADMILAPETIAAGVAAMRDGDLVGAYVSEVVMGSSWLARVRRFERGFYDGTVIDCARFIRRSVFVELGGFDTGLTASEDWDLDRRLRATGRVELLASSTLHEAEPVAHCGTAEEIVAACRRFDLKGALIFHNEAEQTLRQYLRKKRGYSPSCVDYVEKWGADDPEIRKQLGVAYRFFGVFLENGKWRRLVRHPLLTCGMYALRVCVGLTYLLNRRR